MLESHNGWSYAHCGTSSDWGHDPYPCFLQVLKEQEPDNPIDVIATDLNAPIPLLFPEVLKVLIRPGKRGWARKIDRHLLAYLKRIPLRAFAFPGLLRQIKRGNYSKAYILRPNPKDAWGPYFAGVPERIGYLNTKNSHVLLTKSYASARKRQHQSLSAIGMLGYAEGSSFEVPAPPLFSIPADSPVPLPNDLLEISESGKLIAFCPGSTGDDKKWPTESFGKLAGWLLERGFQTIILGASEDQATAQHIIDSSPTGSLHDLTGRFDLIETIKVLSCCHTVISNDTGLMHAAAACGVITLGIFIITNPTDWRPLGPAAHYVSTYVDGSDIEALKRQPPTPEQVIAELEGLL